MTDDMAAKKILQRAAQMIPPLSANLHKGQLGRVAVVGGSEDYTGAPFFSAMTSARVGADMSHVICTPSAAAVVKTYSPNLMIHPLMFQSESTSPISTSKESATELVKPIVQLLDRLHVLVIGPGLGRDRLMFDIVTELLQEARKREMPVVIDADALSLVAEKIDVVKGWSGLVLTPNVAEFAKLCKAVSLIDEATVKAASDINCKQLAKKLDGVTVVQKGSKDTIGHVSNEELVVSWTGGPKRSSGQGDLLTGSLATFLAWRKAYLEGTIDGWPSSKDISPEESLGLAVYAASVLTREASRRAFARKGRGVVASDLLEEVPDAFRAVFGDFVDDEKMMGKL